MDILFDELNIKTHQFHFEVNQDDKIRVTVEFKVNSEQYHDVTTKLYAGQFFIKVPEKNLAFHGRIKEYSTSITNLYEKGQEGNFHLVLEEY